MLVLGAGEGDTRRTFLVGGKNKEIDVAVELGIWKRLELIWVRVIPDGVVRIHPLCVVGQDTWSASQ